MELREEIKVKTAKLSELESLIQRMEMEHKIMKDLLRDKDEVMKGKDDIVRSKEDEITNLYKQFDEERETFSIMLQVMHSC